jgi:hypothetical protein
MYWKQVKIIGITLGILLFIRLILWGHDQDVKGEAYDRAHPHADVEGVIVDVRSYSRPGNQVGGAALGYVLAGPLGALAGASDEGESSCRIIVRSSLGDQSFTLEGSNFRIKDCLLSKPGDKVTLRWDWRNYYYGQYEVSW